MKILLVIAVLIILVLIYCLYEFYKEIEDYKRFTIELNDLIADKNKLLKHIEYRANENAGKQYYHNPAIGFREIAKLTQIKILDTDHQSNI